MRLSRLLGAVLSSQKSITYPSPISPVIGAQTTNYQSTNTTSAVITLPAYTYGSDVLLLFVARNQTDASAMVGDSSASVTELANSGTRRATLLQVTPANAGITSFTLTQTASALTRWVCVAVSNVLSSRIIAQAGPSQADTTSAISFTNPTLSYTANGSETTLAMGCCNSSATFTTDANTLYASTTGNVPIMIEKSTPGVGYTSIAVADIDRGLAGTSRTEASIAVVLTGRVTNYLATGGFETDSNADGLANDWTAEHTTATPATYTLSTTTGITQGTHSQRMQYTGEVGNDGSQKVEYYQAVTGVFSPGNNAQFSIYISGSLSGGNVLLAVEAHTAGNAYIAESSVTVLAASITSTPTQYIVNYVNLPALTSILVVAVLTDDLNPSAAVNLFADQAVVAKSN